MTNSHSKLPIPPPPFLEAFLPSNILQFNHVFSLLLCPPSRSEAPRSYKVDNNLLNKWIRSFSVVSLSLLCNYITMISGIAYYPIKLGKARKIIWRHAIIYIVYKINIYKYVNILDIIRYLTNCLEWNKQNSLLIF